MHSASMYARFAFVINERMETIVFSVIVFHTKTSFWSKTRNRAIITASDTTEAANAQDSHVQAFHLLLGIDLGIVINLGGDDEGLKIRQTVSKLGA